MLDTMRILQLHNRYRQVGGEDGVVAAEAGLLRSRGHVVEQYMADNRRLGHLGALRAATLAVWNPSAYAEIRRIIRNRAIDVVHAHNLFPQISPAAYYAASREDIPVVQTIHNYRLACPAGIMLRAGTPCTLCVGRRAKVPAVRYACYRNSRSASAAVAFQSLVHGLAGSYHRRVSVFVALTAFAREVLVRDGLPADKVVVKPNFVARDPKKGSGAGGFVLFVGRLAPEKGVRMMLDAWANRSDLPPLQIVGDGPERSAVEKATRDSRVRYSGYCSGAEVFTLMRDAIALVLPSLWYEGMPLTVLESMACGTPVIAPRLGGLPELVEDGRNGVLFAPGSWEDLSDAVAGLCRSSLVRTAFRDQARSSYVQHYTPDGNYRQLIDVYRRALGRKP